MGATSKNPKRAGAIAYALISLLLTPLTVADPARADSARADSAGGEVISSTHIETKSIAYIPSGGSNCFGLLISSQHVLVPKVSCRWNRPHGVEIVINFPLISSGLGNLSSTLVEDSGSGYFILSLRKTLSPVTIDPMSLIKDIGDRQSCSG
jgi:hypothetical protein